MGHLHLLIGEVAMTRQKSTVTGFKEYRRCEGDLGRCKKRCGELEGKRQQIEEGIRQEIRTGKTTGNRIRDFVIASYGIQPSVEEDFAKLERSLKGKVGELVLVITGRWERLFHSLMPDPRNEDVWIERLLLGVLTDDQLVLNLEDRAVAFPTGGSYVESSEGKSELHRENLPVRGIFFSSGFELRHHLLSPRHRETPEPKFLTGTKRVERAFRERYRLQPENGLAKLQELTKMLGTLVLTPETVS